MQMLLGLIIGFVLGALFMGLWGYLALRSAGFEMLPWRKVKTPELPESSDIEDSHSGPYREPGEVVEDAPGTPFDPKKSYEVISNRLTDDRSLDDPGPPRSSKEGDSLTEYELEVVRAGTCPDCGHDEFLAGPRGGMAQNFKCANDGCGSRFNDMGPFGIDRISNASPDKPPFGVAMLAS